MQLTTQNLWTQGFWCLSNVPKNVLQRLAPKIEELAARDIPPEDGSPLTEDQLALRKLFRELGSHQPLPGMPGREECRSDGISQQKRQDETHAMNKAILSSWLKKIEILRSASDLFQDETLLNLGAD